MTVYVGWLEEVALYSVNEERVDAYLGSSRHKDIKAKVAIEETDTDDVILKKLAKVGVEPITTEFETEEDYPLACEEWMGTFKDFVSRARAEDIASYEGMGILEECKMELVTSCLEDS